MDKVGIDTDNVRSKAERIRLRAEKWLESKPAPESLKINVKRFLALATNLDLPLRDLAILIGTVAYIVTPFDVIFDYIPFLGWSDDLTVTALALQTLKHHWRETEAKVSGVAEPNGAEEDVLGLKAVGEQMSQKDEEQA